MAQVTDEEMYEDWNGHSRTSIAWMKDQVNVIERLKNNPSDQLDLIGLSRMLSEVIYKTESLAKINIQRYMVDLISWVATNDDRYRMYYGIDTRTAVNAIKLAFDGEEDHLSKVVSNELQKLYENAIWEARDRRIIDKSLNMDRFDLLPKISPWSVDDLLNKGIQDLVLILTEAMDKNKD